MGTPKEKQRANHFLEKKRHSTLGEKALGKQPRWKADGSNREQMPDHTIIKTIEQESGTQQHHPSKAPQPKQMRFLPDAGRGE